LSDFIAEPNELPMLRARTVSPKTSPTTRSTRKPGTSFIVLTMKGVFPTPIPKHLPIPFWVTITVLSRDVFILVGAAAINIVSGFRAFQPSLPGKISTLVQIVAVATVMLAAQIRVGTGYYLPTVYALVFAFTLFSGIHYIFFVSGLINKSSANSDSAG